MSMIRWALGVVVVSLVGSDPAGLVHRLGAPKYADREAASRDLEKLGADALPALKAARVSRDAEIRSRAEVLLERIESDLLVRPSLIALDFHDRPVSEIVREIGARGHVALSLQPSATSPGDRRIDLARPEPVPFWTLSRTCWTPAGSR